MRFLTPSRSARRGAVARALRPRDAGARASGPAARRERARTARRVLVLLLVAAALKLAFLAAPRSDLIGDREAGPLGYAHHGEEAARASIAIAVREGPLMPVGDYQWTHFFGGALVVGLATIPYFELFGENFFALKLVPLSFELLVVLFGYSLYERLFGPRAAWIGGLLLAVSTPGLAILSTIAWGTHSSLNAFVLLGLLCYVSSLPREGSGGGVHLGRRFAFGLVSGFATYFGYGYLLVLAATGVYESTRGRAALARGPLAAVAAGFAIGFSPWLRYNLAHDFAGLEIYHRSIADHFSSLELLARVPERTVSLFVEMVPGSFFHRDLGPIPGAWLAVPAAAALLALAGLGAARLVRSLAASRRAEGRPGLPPSPGWLLALHAGIVAAALTAGDFWPDDDFGSVVAYRYLAPLFPGLFGLAAAGADLCLGQGPRVRAAAVALVAVVLSTGVAGQAGLVRPSQWGALWSMDSDRREGHGRWLALRWAEDPDRLSAIAAAILERRAPEQQEILLRKIGDGLRVAIHRTRRATDGYYDLELLLASQRRLREELPEPHRRHFVDAERRPRGRAEASYFPRTQPLPAPAHTEGLR